MTQLELLFSKIGGFPKATTAMLVLVPLVMSACGGHEARKVAGDRPVLRAAIAEAIRIDKSLEVEVFGTVEAEQSAAISARVMAMVTSVPVRAGDRVRRGQVLIEIDPQAAQGQLAQARGALAQAEAARTLAERNFRRFEALVQKDAASELELDTARMHFEQAEGAVEQAEGAVRAASALANDASVEAPYRGRVARRMVEVGDLAAPGRPLLLLESDRGRRLSIEVPERVASQAGLAVAQRVRVAIDVRPDLGEFEGSVVEVAPGADPMTHTVTAKVDLPASDLPSGVSGRAWLATGRRSIVAVPTSAVLYRGGLTLVVMLSPEGHAVTRAVTSGKKLLRRDADVTAGEWIEILSGLNGGETVLVGLLAPPPAGTPVEIES